MKPTIYIACALTHVPREVFTSYAAYQHRMANHLKQKFNIDVKYALINSDPQLAEYKKQHRAKQCYELDRNIVEHSALVIGECTFPSIGLGIELQIAQSMNIPMILLHSSNNEYKAEEIQYTNPDGSTHHLQIGAGFITLMALGMPNVKSVLNQNFDCCEFDTLDHEVSGVFKCD